MWSKKKKKKIRDDNQDDQEYRSLCAYRYHALMSVTPIIPFDVQLKEHTYRCINPGPVGWQYEHLLYIKDEVYTIIKSRFSPDYVKITGRLHNHSKGIDQVYKHPFSVPVKNCKQYLKIV